jgi:large subunit ribosomal protein L16
MLLPKKVKYRKIQKGKCRGLAIRGSRLCFGEYGLKSLDNGLLRSNHIEAARVLIARKMKGTGKLWINVFPAKPVTKKPAETRQGKGKGDLDHWVCPIHRGRILFEMGGVPEEFAKTIFRLVAFKMPMRTKFVTRSGAAQ